MEIETFTIFPLLQGSKPIDMEDQLDTADILSPSLYFFISNISKHGKILKKKRLFILTFYSSLNREQPGERVGIDLQF